MLGNELGELYLFYLSSDLLAGKTISQVASTVLYGTLNRLCVCVAHYLVLES